MQVGIGKKSVSEKIWFRLQSIAESTKYVKICWPKAVLSSTARCALVGKNVFKDKLTLCMCKLLWADKVLSSLE